MEAITPRHLVIGMHGMNSHPYSLCMIEEYAKKWFHDVDVLLIQSNAPDGLTLDGIAKGGERMAREVRQYLDQHNGYDRVSFIGVSLGGLYARYCVGVLGKWMEKDKRLKLVNFITFVSPHVGLRHLLPFTVEQGLWFTCGETGKELLLADADKMIIKLSSGNFLYYLSKFVKRVMISAYEDRVVPLVSATADHWEYPLDEPEFIMACSLRALGWETLIVDYEGEFCTAIESHSLLHKSNHVLKVMFKLFLSL